jgi:hypothetical protein
VEHVPPDPPEVVDAIIAFPFCIDTLVPWPDVPEFISVAVQVTPPFEVV